VIRRAPPQARPAGGAGPGQPIAEAAAQLDVGGWRAVLSLVRAHRPGLASILEHAALLRFDSDRVELGYETGSVLVGQATDVSAKQLLRGALDTHFGCTPELVFETIAPRSGKLTPTVAAAQADPLRENLQRARRIAPQLASATDEVNAALAHVEHALVALNLGVTASVELAPASGRRDGWEQHLRFGKDGATWRLLLESGPDNGDTEDWSLSPLLSTSKEVRLQAVERLPALIDELVEVAEEQVDKFKAAAAKARAIAATISEAR